MRIIGLTGSFGTGKSFVASLFKGCGAVVIDADAIAHRCLAKGMPAYRKILARFGRSFLRSDGSIDRSALGRLVFADARKRRALERIVHPDVIAEIVRRLSRLPRNATAVIDAPLLIEAGLAKAVDCLIVVTASEDRQIARCVKKFGMTPEEVRDRIAQQVPLEKKIGMADFVIDNDGTRSATRTQARKVWCMVWK